MTVPVNNSLSSIVSVSSTGDLSDGDSYIGGLVTNASGSFVLFYSSADNLVAGDTNSSSDIFVENLNTGAVTRVSTNGIGAQADNSSFAPVFSSDGNNVAFYSFADNLVAGDSNGVADVFVKNLLTGAIVRASTDSTGAQSDGGSYGPVFSPDGAKVAFYSDATNLVAGDTNARTDIFIKDLSLGTTTRVSTASDGSQANDSSYGVVFSPDGSKIAFQSVASNLVTGDTNGFTDLFVKDLVSGVVTRVSTAGDGAQGDAGSFAPVFSPDGTKIAFWSDADNLVSGDTNFSSDIFVKNLVTGAITRISTGAAGQEADGGSSGPAFSPDGTKVAFYSEADNLVSGDTNDSGDVFIKDLSSGAITRVSVGASGGQTDDWSFGPVFSSDGSKIGFNSNAGNIVSGDTNGTVDVFVRSLSSFDTTPPAAPSIAAITPDSGAIGDHLTNATSLAISGTAEAGSAVEVFQNGVSIGVVTADGGGNWGTSIPNVLANGTTYQFTAKASDGTGNTSVLSSSYAVTVDTVAPGSPSITGITDNVLPLTGTIVDFGTTNDATLGIAGTAEAGSTVRIFDTDGATVVGISTGGVFTITTTALGDGSHTLTAQATDAAGNQSSMSSPFHVTIDTTAPTAPVITSVIDDVLPVTGSLSDNGSTNDATPTLSGTAEAGTIVSIYDTDGTTVVGSGSAAAGGFSIAVSALGQGSHTLTARSTDTAGNLGAVSAAFHVTIVTSAPSAPMISSVTDDVAPITGTVPDNGNTNDATLTVAGTAQDGTTVKIYDTDGTTVLGSGLASGGTYSITTIALGQGNHTLTARATDAASNEGAASAAFHVAVDTVAPATPVITGVTDDVPPTTGPLVDGASSNDTTLTIGGTADAGSTVNIYDTDGLTVVGTGTASGGVYSITTSVLGQGSHTLTARATDAAGNQSGASTAFHVTVDTTAPAPPVITGVTDDVAPVTGTILDNGSTNDSMPTVSGIAELGTTVNIYDTDGVTVVGSGTASGGVYSITTLALGQGSHTLTARATDAAGNQSGASTAFHVTVDTIAPATPLITSVTDDVAPQTGLLLDNGSTNDVTPTIAGTAEVGSAVAIFDTDGTTVLGTATAGVGGAWTITTSALGVGSHTLAVRATDAVGNQSNSSSTFHVTVDTTAPQAPFFDGLGSLNFDGSMSLGGTTEANASLTLFDAGSSIGTTSADGSGHWFFTTAPLSNTAHIFTATATDSAGNASGLSGSMLFGSTVPETLTGGTGNDVLSGGVEGDWIGEVYRLYGATLDREPDGPGLDSWVSLLRNGAGLEQVAGGFTGSQEFQDKYGSLDDTGFVTLLYNNVLHRAPDPDGLANWVNSLGTGATRTSVVVGFSESAEYKGNEQGALGAFVQNSVPWDANVLDGGGGSDTASYAAASAGVTVNLHLTGPQETFGAGIDWLKNIENLTGSSFDDTLTGSGYGGVISGGAGNDVLSDGVGSVWMGEVYRLYGATLDREPDAGGLGGWEAYLEGGATLVQAAGGFTGSQEFQSKYGTLDDTDFVTLLYHNVLDRDPDPGGLAAWLNLLETGTSRTSVVVGFSESPEYQTNTAASLGTYVQNYLQDLKTAGGVNVLDGGDGVNTASYASAMSGVTVDLGITGPQDTLGAGVDTLKNIQNLVGSSFNDTFTGTDGANVLTGGPGSDTFRYTAASQSAPSASDTITDFTSGQDKIDFSALAGLGNSLASTGTAPSTIDPHALLAYVSGGNTILYVNTTAGSQTLATADMAIHLTGVTNLADTDILHHT